MILDGVAGIEVSTEKVWGFAEEFKLPAALVVNKLDRERSSFERAWKASMSALDGRVPIQMPLGSEKNFNGVIDMVRMKCFTYQANGNGRGTEGDIPESEQEAATSAHEALVEMIAEGNDELMEEFFATGTLPVEHIVSGLKKRCGRAEFSPYCVPVRPEHRFRSAAESSSPRFFLRRSSARGLGAEQQGAERGQAHFTRKEPPAIFVFKTAADPFAGRLSYLQGDVRCSQGRCALDQSAIKHQRAAGSHRHAVRQNHAAGAGTPRRRHRRGGKAEGHTDGRHDCAKRQTA